MNTDRDQEISQLVLTIIEMKKEIKLLHNNNQILSRYLGFNKKEYEQIPVNDVSTETEVTKIPKYELNTPVLGVKQKEFLNSFNIPHPSAESILQSPKGENRSLNDEELSFLEQLKKPAINKHKVLETFLINEPQLSSTLFKNDISTISTPIEKKTGSSPMRILKKKLQKGYVPEMSPQMHLRRVNKNLNLKLEGQCFIRHKVI
jgi:hypothetical protein